MQDTLNKTAFTATDFRRPRQDNSPWQNQPTGKSGTLLARIQGCPVIYAHTQKVGFVKNNNNNNTMISKGLVPRCFTVAGIASGGLSLSNNSRHLLSPYVSPYV